MSRIGLWCVWGVLVVSAHGNMLLEYYSQDGSQNFSQLLSLSDGSTTLYELKGSAANTYPVWVDNVDDPPWASIAYGDPQAITFKQGTCSTTEGCAMVDWTTSTVNALSSSSPVNEADFFVFVENSNAVVVPEPNTLPTACIMLLLPAARALRRVALL